MRRHREILPIDAPVDDALADLAPALYLLYGRPFGEDPA
ncbi:hypothetical protein D779_2073 [Imhoffiella purpurea]|uniref:Uncharacterized protein n=2 Tax=Imhoffiella purpurea TaxID=1249627 RepID=W9VFR6_9GAMM|nr:hypothetical protein D779_2073 [Imhoffiella purpurea]